MVQRGFQEWARGSASTEKTLVGVILKSLRQIIVAAAVVLVASIAFAAESVPGQFLVQLKRPSSQYDSRALEKGLSAKIIDKVRPDMILVQRPGEESVESALKDLRAKSVVKLAEPNFIYKLVRTPDDPEYSRLWGLNNNGGVDSDGTRGLKGVDIGVERAWDITIGSREITVAVIDTGIDFKIPDLANNAWVNSLEKAGQPGVDDDQNGYVDDIHGYDFVKNKGDVADDNGHGSHCAGTIGAEGGDGLGLVGVNWQVSLMGVRFLDAAGSGTLANAIKAIDYARKNGARVLSNSWGGGSFSQALQVAIEETKAANQLFIAAAGNDGADNDRHDTYPANYDVDNIISVAAVDNRGELAYFSNFGINKVHVAGPGVNVLSTVPSGTDTYSGTSMATPHVAGVAALALSKDRELTYMDLKKRLLESARPLKTLDGKIMSGGMIDAYYALTGLKPPPDPNDPSIWPNQQAQEVSTPHPYTPKLEQTYTIKVEGATRIAARFSRFETEATYDRVSFYNGRGEALGAWSGKKDGRYSPIADGDTLVLKFTADGSVQGHGFDIDAVVFER